MLRALAAGTLRTEANEATRKSGFGRIKHEDGSYEDLDPHSGGIVRTVLDHVELNSEEELDHVELNSEEEIDWALGF